MVSIDTGICTLQEIFSKMALGFVFLEDYLRDLFKGMLKFETQPNLLRSLLFNARRNSLKLKAAW